jgi:hypothetical protein
MADKPNKMYPVVHFSVLVVWQGSDKLHSSVP